MKIAYKHIAQFIDSKPSIEELSQKLFQLGHEHEIHDNIFDIEFTPNRGDCLSLNGILRDLKPFYNVEHERPKYQKDLNDLKIKFINNAKSSCPKISFLKVDIEDNIKSYQGELNDYFDDLDINKNNFFTDISNYISYETGQPTHCYDAKKIDDEISLEFINETLSFETLLDTKVELKDKNLVFKKQNEIINIAGLMGGKSTACSKNTRSVLIECAYFNPEDIIGKSVKYSLNSEAAHKFERGVDPKCHESILRRFLFIIGEHSSIINAEIFSENYTSFIDTSLPLKEKCINSILGTDLKKNEIINYLDSLGFNVVDDIVYVPPYRNDINSENDIAEEIARIIGYNNLPIKEINIPHTKTKEDNNTENLIRSFLIENSFNEVINNPFVKNPAENSIKLDNPLDSNRKYLRTSIKNSLIDNLTYNERRQKDSIKLFEISDLYHADKNEIKKEKKIGIICSGRVGKNYLDFSKKIDKKYFEELIKKFSDKINYKFENISRESLNTKHKDKINYIEFNINNIEIENIKYYIKQKSLSSFINYKPISDLPSSIRDLSFSISDVNQFHNLQQSILGFKNDLIKEIFIFDFYNNGKQKVIKLGFRFIFQNTASTITEKEINLVMDDIIEIALSYSQVSIPGISLRT